MQEVPVSVILEILPDGWRGFIHQISHKSTPVKMSCLFTLRISERPQIRFESGKISYISVKAFDLVLARNSE